MTVVIVTVVIVTVVIVKIFSKNNLNILTTKAIFKGQRFAILAMFCIGTTIRIGREMLLCEKLESLLCTNN